jgi:hypothetical protein
MIKNLLAAGTLAATSIAAPVSAAPFSDVAPSQWAYQAIQNLNQTYGCLVGYPNGTLKPEQFAKRSEMIALTNACLDRIAEFQTVEDAKTAQALRAQADALAGVSGRVATLEGVAAKKAFEVGNYLGAGVLLNRQGVDSLDYTAERTVAGGTVQGRYAVKTFTNQNAVSVRPYVNFVAGPDSQIGAGGGALLSYDFSLARKAGVSTTNLYLGAGYQVPFVNNTEANFQSAVGEKGQVVLAVGLERRITNSLTAFADLKFPTTNASYTDETSGDNNKGYSPVLTVGAGFKF